MNRACLCLLALLLALGCDDEPTTCGSDADCSDDQTCADGVCMPRGDAGDVDDGGAPPDASVDAGPACTEDCGDGECIGGACCDAARSCDGVCCAMTQVCSFAACVDIGIECFGAEDCGADEYCELSLGESTAMCGTVEVSSGRCLPRPPACPAGSPPDPTNPTCIAECSFTPPASDLAVRETYAWGMFDGDRLPPNLDDVRNSPIVINLDDDDCDGRITARDIPEVVVITSPDDGNRPDGTNPLGDLVALAVDEGTLVEKWRAPAIANPWTYPAAGDVDGMPGNEVVVCSVDRRTVRLFGVDAAGTGFVERWQSPDIGGLCGMPSLADLDQDGDVEIITRAAVLDGATGAIELTYAQPPSGFVVVSDVDDDPDHRLEVVSARRIYRAEAGQLTVVADNGIAGTHPLVTQLDGMGPPEIVAMNNGDHSMTVWRYDAAAPGNFVVVRSRVDINGSLDPTDCPASSAGRTRGGGPPTAGDVNADGVPDIAVAGGVGYAVLDGARIMDPTVTDPLTLFFWTQNTVDCSSAQTGSSFFDFNGDGRAEVLYADEHTFRIYRGATGDVLFEACNTNGTILEQPIVADIDNDGQADIVVASNARYRECLDAAGTATSGIRVYSSRDGDWVRTRRVWNQHPYHITNVGEDGTIPTREAPNWDDPSLNNFRLNRQPGNQTAAADAVVQVEPRCSGLGLFVTVRNLGESVLPAGTNVEVYRGTYMAGTTPPAADRIAMLSTTRALYPAQAERFEVDLPAADQGPILLEGSLGAFALVSVPGGTQECRPDNNVGSLMRLCQLL